ncbi:MAG: thioredoxin family protein [Euryarchaeota archaeon]|nr:thioredoxin family protein [Euryarchaeota archaeon]
MKERGMFTLIVLVALVACLMSACIDPTAPSQPSASETPGAGITWYSYEEGMEIAQAQNKPVMIDIYTNWCKYCKELDRVVYTDSNVINLADKFVCIKFNADKRRDLAAKYNSPTPTNPRPGVPSIVFLKSDGTETHRTGYKGGAEPFVQDMMVALNNA